MAKDKKKKNQVNVINIALAFIVACITMLVVCKNVFNANEKSKIEKVKYSDFLQMVSNHEVDTVYYNESNDWMTFTLFNDNTKDLTIEERQEYKNYTTDDKRMVQYPGKDVKFRERMLTNNVILKIVPMEETLGTKILNYLPLITVVAMLVVSVVLLKNMTNSNNTLLGGGSRKAKIEKSDKKFSDVIGHTEVVDSIKFIVDLIKDPTIGNKIGARIPKGILLSGPPGTGKTLLAKAIAGEAGVTFVNKNSAAFVDTFVGVGAKNVRQTFELARENAPCVLFLDEFDAVGKSRTNKSSSEDTQTIDAILQEMDGFTSRDGVFIIAATNRPETLDAAVTRSGRFDRQIVLDLPKDWTERKELFDFYLSKTTHDESISTENISKQTSGFSQADIEAVVNEAAIIAVMQKADMITREHIEEAIDQKIFNGNRSKKEQYFKDKEIVAYHEAGHAVMSYLLNEPVSRVSILATVSGVGGAVFNAEKESVFKTNKDFEHQILICYAGRASEEIKYNAIVTTGASSDITQATNIMTKYIENYGFDKDFGLLDVGVLSNEHLVNSDKITEKLSGMSKVLYEKCVNQLKDNYYLVEALAKTLLEEETLNGDEFYEVINKAKQ